MMPVARVEDPAAGTLPIIRIRPGGPADGCALRWFGRRFVVAGIPRWRDPHKVRIEAMDAIGQGLAGSGERIAVLVAEGMLRRPLGFLRLDVALARMDRVPVARVTALLVRYGDAPADIVQALLDHARGVAAARGCADLATAPAWAADLNGWAAAPVVKRPGRVSGRHG